MAGRLRVAERQAVPQVARLVVGEREEVGHRAALDVRRAQEVLDGELPAGEIALQREVGDAHAGIMPDADRHVSSPAWRRTVVIVGSPTALGGHLAGMERTPGRRSAGWARPRGWRRGRRLAGTDWTDAGDAANDPGWAPDPDPRAKNRELICAYLPRLAEPRRRAVCGSAGPGARLLVIGGDCTSHAGAMAGLRRAQPGMRLGLAWFDAHGDFNIAGHDAVGQRLGHAVRDGLRARRAGPRSRPATRRRSVRPTPRCSAARCSTSGVADARRRAAWPSSGPGCSADAGRSGGAARLGRDGRGAGSTAGTSRSTSTRSTRPTAGRWRRPSPTGSRSRRRWRRCGSSRRAGPGPWRSGRRRRISGPGRGHRARRSTRRGPRGGRAGG